MSSWTFRIVPFEEGDALGLDTPYDGVAEDGNNAETTTIERFGILTVDAEHSANAIGEAFIEDLENVLEEVETVAPTLRAILISSAKPDHFIAGADIDEIARIQYPDTARSKALRARRVFDRIAGLDCMTFALLRGTTLGGGFELALAADFRIAVDIEATKIGLPETQLGIVPGFGGTQRLPRLVGVQNALALILRGTRLPAKAARSKGLVDAVIPGEGIDRLVIRAMKRIVSQPTKVRRKRRNSSRGFMGLLLERNAIGRGIVRKQAKKGILSRTHGHYPAPIAAVDLIVDATHGDPEKGFQKEARVVGDLVVSNVAKELIGIFRQSERAKNRAEELGVDVVEVDRNRPVVVIGAGVMGAGAAARFLESGYAVRLRDLAADGLARGLSQIGRIVSGPVKKRRRTSIERDTMLARLTYSTDSAGTPRAGAVFEAIVEDLSVKRSLIESCEPWMPDDALFLTNTSSLSVEALQSGARHPGRVVGLHFFNPVERMPLVEVIPGPETEAWATARACQIAVSLGKSPVIVKDCAGFLVNRLLGPLLDSGTRLLEAGYDGPTIDREAEAAGLPMGPFRLLDEIGLDIAAHVAETLEAAYGERMSASPVIETLRSEGLVGRKGKKGFYDYSGSKPTWNQSLRREFSGTRPIERDFAFTTLVDPMVDEATRALDEEVVADAAILDFAMVFGTGFPPFTGGPLRWADSQGLAGVVERLEERHRQGWPRTPSAVLVTRATSGSSFRGESRSEGTVSAR